MRFVEIRKRHSSALGKRTNTIRVKLKPIFGGAMSRYFENAERDKPSIIELRIDDLSSEASQSIVREHLAGMLENTPAKSVHALPLDKLRNPSITFWTAWIGSELCGCGALKTLDSQHGEVKTMRTRAKFLRQGVGQAVLTHIILQASQKGMRRLSLETGSSNAFSAARAMYLRNGFEICGPFSDYTLDPHSVFMAKQI